MCTKRKVPMFHLFGAADLVMIVLVTSARIRCPPWSPDFRAKLINIEGQGTPD